MTLSNGCTVEENLRDAAFYRHVIVFTPFAATALGLASICLLALYQYLKRRGMLQAVATSDQARANIQISESSYVHMYDTVTVTNQLCYTIESTFLCL
jgi:hypothetical protein